MTTQLKPKEWRHPNLTEFYACLLGVTPDVEKARQMVIDGEVINDNTATAQLNPLSYVVELGLLELCELMLDYGAQPNHVGKTGFFPLYVAVRKQQPNGLDIIKLLMERGARTDLQFVDGNTPLLEAVANGNLEYVQFLLDHGSFLDERNNGGLTSLHLAVKEGHLDVAKELLKRGADVNGKSNPVLKKKVQGPNRNKSGISFTPLHMTYLNKYVVQPSDSDTMLHLLLNNGANVDAQLENGRTALHLYAIHNCVTMATTLIKAGCDLNLISTENEEMKTALHKAIDGNIDSQHYDMVRLLCESGADVNIRDSRGCTPVMSACKLPTKTWQRESIVTLIQHGSDLSVRDNNGMTAFEIGKGHLHQNFSLVFREASANVVDLINHCEENSLLSPLSLMQSCRSVIRCCLLPGQMHAKIDTLSVPSKIKSYIKMQHLADLLSE